MAGHSKWSRQTESNDARQEHNQQSRQAGLHIVQMLRCRTSKLRNEVALSVSVGKRGRVDVVAVTVLDHLD
jgi:hypothetical protein